MATIKATIMSKGVVRSYLRRAGELPINVLSAAGAFDLLHKARHHRAAILCYHGVSDEPPALGANRYVTTRRFEEQMVYLSKNTNVVPLEDLVTAVEKGQAVSPRTIAITFDDGLGHLCRTALPILQRHGLTATFFLTTDSIEMAEPIWTNKVSWLIENYPAEEMSFAFADQKFRLKFTSPAERAQSLSTLSKFGKGCAPSVLAALELTIEEATMPLIKRTTRYDNPNIAPMTWADVRRIGEAGHKFGSHTRTHCIVTNCDPISMKDELLNSRLIIESNTQAECRLFAYPNGVPGDFNQASRTMLEECGYLCGLTTVYGLTSPSSDLFDLPRVGVSRKDNIAVFKSKLCGLWWNGTLA